MLKSDVLKFAGNAASALAAAFATLGSMGTHRRVRTLRSAPLRPTGKALRNPTDPFQAERIERAAAKRQRKADNLTRNTVASYLNNVAQGSRVFTPLRLNPFNVNR